MTRFFQTFSDFTRGEVSELVQGRVDLEDYVKGCRTLENFLIQVTGGIERRPGLYFVREVKDSSKKVRLVPYRNGSGQQYVLEVGNTYLRVYKASTHSIVLNGGNPLEIGSPSWTEAQLPAIFHAQSENIIYFANRNWSPYKLVKNTTSDTDWTLSTPTFTDPPWSTNYPDTVTFHQKRTWWQRGQNIYGSQMGNFETFTIPGTPTDDSGINYKASVGLTLEGTWMVGRDHLYVGFDGVEAYMPNSPSKPYVSATMPAIQVATGNGSAAVQAVLLGHAVLYLQKGAKRLRELSYSNEGGGYFGLDLTLLASHILGTGVTQMVMVKNPDPMLLCVTSDGYIAALTYDKLAGVSGWSRIVTDGDFESLAVVDGTTEDEVWAVVKRTIGGSTKRYVEYFKPRAFSEQSDAFFVDSGVTVDYTAEIETVGGITQADPGVITLTSGFEDNYLVKISGVVGMTEVNGKVFKLNKLTSTTFELYLPDGVTPVDTSGYGAWVSGGSAQRVMIEVSGLAHLEGEEVAIAVDGGSHGPKTVASGAITLDDYAIKAHAGLPYTSTLLPQRLKVAPGLTLRVDRAIIRFSNSLGCKVGPSLENLQTMEFRFPEDEMDSPPPMTTGDRELNLKGSFSKAGDVYVVQDLPLPMNILFLIVDGSYYER